MTSQSSGFIVKDAYLASQMTARHSPLFTLESGQSGLGIYTSQRDAASYFEERKDAIYLFAAKQICKKYAPHPQSVIDVGSNQTPILEWFRDGQALDDPRLTSLDLRKPYEAPGIESVALDLMKYRPESIYDLVTCFQVMEHVPDPSSFGKKLLTLGKVIVVSVPYKWPKGSCKYHLHDPVTSALLESWMGTSPKFKYIARELNKKERLIHVYRNY